MKNIISLLENNLFSDVLIRKGVNTIADEVYTELCKNKQFKSFAEQGYIKVETETKKEDLNKEKSYENMSYSELKAYVQKNNIEVKSLKKADILEALKGV